MRTSFMRFTTVKTTTSRNNCTLGCRSKQRTTVVCRLSKFPVILVATVARRLTVAPKVKYRVSVCRLLCLAQTMILKQVPTKASSLF
jgi:hypothetical protein